MSRRALRVPGLDASPDEYEDLFGPAGQDPRGLDRLIGEGRVELPEISRDPLLILTEPTEASLTDEEADQDAPITLISSVRTRRTRSTWFAPGYAPGSSTTLRRRPPQLQRTLVSKSLSELRSAYAHAVR